MKEQKNLLNVTLEEWDYVKKIMTERSSKNMEIQKIRNKDHPELNHSFIFINNEPYAMAKGEIIGKGNFGKVKIVQNADGVNFAVKIEDPSRVSKGSRELEILTELDQLKGFMVRKRPKQTQDYVLRKYIKDKRYVLQTLIPGENLYTFLKKLKKGQVFLDLDFLKQDKKSQRLIIACKIAEAIKQLHDKNIIHLDIKPQNFLIDIQNDNVIAVNSVDFGFSKLLKHQDETLELPIRGTPKYLENFSDAIIEYKKAKKIYKEKHAELVKFKKDPSEKLSQVLANIKSKQKDKEHGDKETPPQINTRAIMLHIWKNLEDEVNQLEFEREEAFANLKFILRYASGKKFKFNKKTDIYAFGKMLQLKFRFTEEELPIITDMLHKEQSKRPSIEDVLNKLTEYLISVDEKAAKEFVIKKKI